MRYFYICPLKAAFMAKYHGFKYIGSFEGEEYPMENESFRLHLRLNLAGDGTIYYGAPDSLHLLEPQVGDVCYSDSLQGEMDVGIIGISNAGKPYVCWVHYGQDIAVDYNGEKIIQRNGIAFHWPESEGV